MLNDFGWLKQVKIKNSSGTVINPATEEKLNELKALLQAIDANTDELELKADTINLNTDTLEAKLQAIIDKLNATISIKTLYKSTIEDVDFVEDSFDLGDTYTEFTIMNIGNNPINIKLNSNTNDVIKLEGGPLGRDVISADGFALSKIYFKTLSAGKTSKVFILALK